MTYSNGFKSVEVKQVGKSFETVTSYPATNRSPAEVITKKHKTWKGVAVQIKNLNQI